MPLADEESEGAVANAVIVGACDLIVRIKGGAFGVDFSVFLCHPFN